MHIAACFVSMNDPKAVTLQALSGSKGPLVLNVDCFYCTGRIIFYGQSLRIKILCVATRKKIRHLLASKS